MHWKRALSCHTGSDPCWQTWHNSTVERLHQRQTRSHGAEGRKDASKENKWMIVQCECATFSKSLNPRNIDKSVSDIRVRSGARLKAVFGYPYPVSSSQSCGYPADKPDSDHLWQLLSRRSRQRWSDSGFLLSDPILFVKNDILIRSESCFDWNHTICTRKLSDSVLWRTTYIFVLCLFCLMRINDCWGYFAFNWTRLFEVVTLQVWNACPA